jgi:uncharacterized protein (DUF885 family)
MNASIRLRELCDDYWEASLRNNPTWATYLGDFRYNDRLSDLSDAGRSRRRAEAEGFLERLKGIALAELPEGDRVTADILRLQLELSIEEPGHKLWQWAVDPLSGPQAEFPQIMNYHPLDDEARLVARFRAFPAHIDQYLDNLRAGGREERTAMRPAVERVIGQLRGLLAVPPEASPFAARPAFIPAAREAVYPAFRKMLEYLEGEYLPKSRERDVGIWALPGGAEAYGFLIRQHVSAGAAPEEIHRVGLEELRQIHEEMRQIAGDDVRAFSERLKKDLRSFYSTGEEILEGARRELDRAAAALPKVFRRLPRAGCEVKAIETYREKDAPGAYYYPPDEKLTRKGIFYANTYEPGTRPRFTMPALAFHEAVPGHHLQITLAMEMGDLPKFRRHAGFTAFVEGWALYAERLADEMGLYEDDLARFGMLTYQAWRAARLVVDTGIHALRWTREQAIGFFVENVALSEGEVVTEIDRYIVWPGQALAYTMGQREILALRAEARKARGARFDLGEFHDALLRNGALPLPTLRRLVREWIAAG